MKRDVWRALITILIIGWSILSAIGTVNADPVYVEPVKMRVTCYLPTGNPTASGVMPFVGGCAAKREWMGGVAVLYTMDGEFVAYMDINDTGGHERIRNGSSIDVFMPDMEAAREWIATYGDYMMVQILPEADG